MKTMNDNTVTRMWKSVLKNKMLLICLVLFFVPGIFNPLFLSSANIQNLLLQVSIYGVLSCGMIFVIISGELDVSVGSLMAFVTQFAVTVINVTNSILLGFLVAVATGFVAGLINGLLVAKLKVDSFVATLAGMAFYRGLGYLLFGVQTIVNKVDLFHEITFGTTFGLYNVVYIYIAFLLIAEFVIKFTVFGRNISATGGNFESARYAGINVDFYKIASFVVASTVTGIAGFLLGSRMNAGSATLGEDAPLMVISAIVIGGSSLNGGYGSALKTLIGMMIIGIITNSLAFLGVNVYYQSMMLGAMLILIVAGDRIYQNRIK